jgi:DNA polymerase-3 subunit gamma/tau
MRDSQSLLEQLLSVGNDKITAADVNQLLGIAPAERLNGLVRHLVNRDAASALAELDATIQGGVEVGLLLDQLVGYFRDVMAATVGCAPDQMLYALPSQVDEVTQIAKELGLSTILAIGQILDHTAARMRVSMHGRTLVEMAIVRICQLGELDELATLVAELRSDSSAQSDGQRSTAATHRQGTDRERPASGSPFSAPGAKKNAEAQVTSSVASGFARSVQEQQKSQASLGSSRETEPEVVRRTDTSHVAHGPPAERNTASLDTITESTATAVDSVLAQFRRAMAEGVSSPPATTQKRPSRREQTAKAAEHPFVRRAMELFEAPPDKLRYTPPEDRSSGAEP